MADEKSGPIAEQWFGDSNTNVALQCLRMATDLVIGRNFSVDYKDVTRAADAFFKFVREKQ